jgi:hypothetical protein
LILKSGIWSRAPAGAAPRKKICPNARNTAASLIKSGYFWLGEFPVPADIRLSSMLTLIISVEAWNGKKWMMQAVSAEVCLLKTKAAAGKNPGQNLPRVYRDRNGISNISYPVASNPNFIDLFSSDLQSFQRHHRP